MSKILAVLLWPAGIAVLCCVGVVLARRGHQSPAAGPGALEPSPPAPGTGAQAGPGGAGVPVLMKTVLMKTVLRFLFLVAAGIAVIYAVMIPLAWLAEHFGPAIDWPIFSWTTSHQVPAWKDLMEVATQAGGKYPTAAAAGIAAVGLAVIWRSDRWLPPVALVSLVVIEHYLTIAIHMTLHRAPPPGSLGTFPSGGTARAVAIYGLIAYFLWREFSGRRRAGIWTAVVVAGLGFNEAYSRGYLAVHWFTDILGGFVYGCLLLSLYVAAVRVIAGLVGAAPGQPSAPPPRPPGPGKKAPCGGAGETLGLRA